MYEQSELLSIDIDELGIRPSSYWFDAKKDANDLKNDYFATQKSTDAVVYFAEMHFTKNTRKTTADGNTSPMSNESYTNDYEIDPETGEKIFHKSGFTSSNSVRTTDDGWIDEYLSNLEASSGEALASVTTANNTDPMLSSFPFPLFDNVSDHTDSDWFSSIFNLEGDTDINDLFAAPITSIEQIETEPQKSDEIQEPTVSELPPLTTVSLNIPSIDTTTTVNTSLLTNSARISFDDEYSNTSDASTVDGRLRKIEMDEDSVSSVFPRRANNRSKSQRQQDEEALQRFNIPLNLNDITQSDTDEYNRLLARVSYLSSEQLHVIKDIRRRGKNKIAAQNCRKRKATNVESLSEEVEELKRVKRRLEEEKLSYQRQISETRREYERLHRQVLPDRQLPPAIMVK